ncbi:acetyltransferase [Nannizzia gypsea CBS 118893]|uniref:Acetyltransferase n=1 Tax=Arthroderma gypseum (strain ATCC MYA-4604 / CBS 118893) TaxID=535722 RepID=E4V6L7_ARTGP|nr:acetyltransferase [Nannizzia gypsea CBS 118893]EFQ96733.1 acetyltransferase [Nannizzia gypsea CBS 118893]
MTTKEKSQKKSQEQSQRESQSRPGQEIEVLDLRSLKQDGAAAVLDQVARIERRTFPPSEAMKLDLSLCKKPNSRLLYSSSSSSSSSSASASAPTTVTGYVMYVRMREKALLHKLCVEAGHRGQGIGGRLLAAVEEQLALEGCQTVHLWVDAGRTAARALYRRRGFEETRTVEDYYGPGRTGINMVLTLPGN